MHLWMPPTEAERLVADLGHFEADLIEQPCRHERTLAPRLVRWRRFNVIMAVLASLPYHQAGGPIPNDTAPKN